ncbi:MAG: sodium:proton antiporter [Ardenticatenales bacterium]
MTIEQVGLLLLAAAVVAMVARRLHVPYSVGLVLAGILLAALSMTPEFRLTKSLIFTAFLPPLVFEAALYIKWSELRRDLPVIVTLATVGVALSAAVTAVGMVWLAGWEWPGAVLFGVLIAATDPVSVIATFREAGVKGRLSLLVESESLFNDSTAAVAFTVALVLATGGQVTAAGVVWDVVRMVLGGIACGALIAGGALALAGRTDDHLVITTFTTVAAYGSFLLAEHYHLSGVLASLTAGLMVGNIGLAGSITDSTHDALESFWEYAAFVANSLIFILIGFRVAHGDFGSVVQATIVAIGLIIVGRALAIYGCCAVFRRSNLRVETDQQHILVWGGLRGALALALALGLPSDLPHASEIVTVSLGVVVFSILVQGLTITPFLRRLGAIPA